MASAEPSHRWSAQFLGMLEALGSGVPRVPAGRRAVRAGQVRQLTISASLVSALVRDEEQTHRARIAVRAFTGADWGRVERDLAGQAYYAAKLLAGEVPDEIDAVFTRSGLTLLPDIGELAMECSCPDWRVPCAHLVAACVALAESFDTDPFGLLAWRGRGREELLVRIGERRPAGANPDKPQAVAAAPDDAPLAECLDTFWAGGPLPSPAPTVPGAVHRPDALLDELDPLRLELGALDLDDLLRAAYRTIGRGTRDG